MIPFQWSNFYSYRQYESHSFMRKCRSMELLWKMQLPFDWTFQVNVFTYSTLNATLRASLQSRTFGRSNLLLFFLVFAWACLSTSNPLRRQQDGTSVPMGMGGLCMSSSLNFVLNFHYSCALSVGFLIIYAIVVAYSQTSPWQVPPLCILTTIAVLYPILFLFQI